MTQDSIPYNREYVSHEEIRPGLLATRKEMLMGARRLIEMNNIRFPADNAWSIYDMYLGSTSIELAQCVSPQTWLPNDIICDFCSLQYAHMRIKDPSAITGFLLHRCCCATHLKKKQCISYATVGLSSDCLRDAYRRMYVTAVEDHQDDHRRPSAYVRCMYV